LNDKEKAIFSAESMNRWKIFQKYSGLF